MASSAEPVELPDGGAHGGNVGVVGSDERSPRPSDAEVLIVDEASPDDPALAAPTDGFATSNNLGCIILSDLRSPRPFCLGKQEVGSARCPERRYIRFFVFHAPPARLLAVRQ